MKRWGIIIAAALVAAWLVVDAVRDFFANDTIQYFASHPYRLLYVGAIAIFGGLVALGFSRLSVRTQLHLKAVAWGAAASSLTAYIGYFAFCLASLASVVVQSGDTRSFLSLLLALLLFSGIAGYLWFECYRAWKTRVSP